MLSIVLVFIGIFIISLTYLLIIKKLNTYYLAVLKKEKVYYLEVECPKDDEIDYTAQLNYFSKSVFSFLILTIILVFLISWVFKFANI